jgi:hypothetical protein
MSSSLARRAHGRIAHGHIGAPQRPWVVGQQKAEVDSLLRGQRILSGIGGRLARLENKIGLFGSGKPIKIGSKR